MYMYIYLIYTQIHMPVYYIELLGKGGPTLCKCHEPHRSQGHRRVSCGADTNDERKPIQQT